MRPHVLELPVPAVVGDRVLGPQLLQQLQRLVEPARALLERHVEVVELLPPVAEPGAEHQTALGHHVEGRDLLGEQHRVVERRDHDVGDEADVRLHLGREPRHQRHRLQPAEVAVQEVLADREVVEPGRLAGLDHREQVAELLRRRDGGHGDVAQQESDADHEQTSRRRLTRINAYY
ncbi:hypothetical protein [Nocardioides sp. TF02-7]|uniref:hypothetical protein n=1 Tax=Nocardioides sp. TF02-7 TaxID=2917724 RepID=UPI0023DCE88A|nr:hypothetical protein [Nocardioides sp. TF02-7]